MVAEENFDDPEPPEDHLSLDDPDETGDEAFVELDPSGRYGRYGEVLGRGAMKTVYKAYDMVDCKEVAWNKAKANTHGAEGHLEEALAIEREVFLLRRLSFKGILKLYNAWLDETSGDTNFITELCSSTLLAFRLKHKYVSRKAVKSWARQILEALVHLHTQDPPIIHRDLKCENIFVKSNSCTTLKIGDFGSATILNETHHMHTLVGTPEFMAPEMFQEDYNELVDIYSFGMCMLELITRECPYSECTSLAQVYKQVIAGKKPKSLHKVKDAQALQLINRCLLPACERPSAKELLDDPFLQDNEVSVNGVMPTNSTLSLRSLTTSVPGRLLFCDGNTSKVALPCGCKKERVNGSAGTDVKEKTTDLVCKDAGHSVEDASLKRSYQVVGTKEGENILRLRIRIQESSHCSNIVFPFDLKNDTPKSVAEEMVRALDYPLSDLLTIADLISEELIVLASISDEGLAAPTSSEKLECPRLKQQQTDNVPESSSNVSVVECNTPLEETATASDEVCCEVSTLLIDEKSKEILSDNSSAASILDSSLSLPMTSAPVKESASSVSGELTQDGRSARYAVSDPHEKSGSSLAKQSGDSYGKLSSIAPHNTRLLHLLAFKNSPSFKMFPKFPWRSTSEKGIQQHPVYVNTIA